MDPNIAKQTQETLGKLITKPPLTEKLLGKPPFRFLHDIITEVIRTTSFLQGLYTDEEMDSKQVTTREGKIDFLQKAITCTSIVHGSTLPARPSKIVAGHEPEHTNELLQVIARCIDKGMSSEEAVKQVLSGDIPTKKEPQPQKRKKQSADGGEEKESTGAESARRSKKEHRTSSRHRSREDKDAKEGREKDEKETKEEKEKRRRERSEKSREGGSESTKEKSKSRSIEREKSRHREDREKSKHREDGEKSKHREDREKSKHRIDREKSKHREDREKSKHREDGEKSKHRIDREKSKHREDREKSKHREREKSKHRDEKESVPPSDEKEKSSKRSEDKEAEKEKRRQERKKRQEQKEKAENVEKPVSGKDEEKIPKQPAKKEKSEIPAKLAEGDKNQKEEENVAAASSRAQRPASAKGQRRRPQTRNGGGRNEITNESPSSAESPAAVAPAVASRKLVRPPSARPSAPRVRRNDPSAADENVEASGQDKNATIIVDRDENMTLSDEEDAQFVVQEDKTAEDPDLLPAVLSVHSNGDLNSEEHGGLVRKILETKKELEGSASKQKVSRTEIQQSNVVTVQQQKEQQLVVQEIEQLRMSVQKLCQSSAPLAKLIDYSQEDMDAMQNELQMWKKENKEHGFKIKEDNNATALSIEPLKSELEELEQAIAVYRTQMAATKANIIRNEDKIQKMMVAVATRA